jgi:putative ABC transport system substrate-binding protein
MNLRRSITGLSHRAREQRLDRQTKCFGGLEVDCQHELRGLALIASLARPGGNVTGLSDNATDLSAKRLELLKEAVFTASRIAVLWNSRDDAMTLRYREIDRAARVLGVSIQPLGVREPDDFERAFSAMNRERPAAMIMVTDVLTILNRKRVLDYAESHRIPAMYEFASLVREGGLISYGPSDDYLFGRAASMSARSSRGRSRASFQLKSRPQTTLSSIPGRRRRTASIFRNHCCCVRSSFRFDADV